MGTSTSYSGPVGPSLLPPWAPDPIPEPVPPEPVPPRLPFPPSPIRPGSWKSAKQLLGTYAAGGKRGTLSRAARAYVGAHGGASAAASSATRTTAGRVAGFLADVAARGAVPAIESLTLVSTLGQPVEIVLAAIVDALAPAGATLDDVSPRQMVDDVFVYLWNRYDIAGGIESLNAMDADGVRDAIRVVVASHIYRRWLQELGAWIERKAVSPQVAVRLERQVREYVEEAVQLDLRQYDVLAIAWAGDDGNQIIERIYGEAYSLLEVHV